MTISMKNLEVGYSFATGKRTLTEADIVNYAGLSNDWDPLHIDQEFAEAGPYGRRIAHGQLTASIVTGLRSELDTWPLLNFLGTARRFRSPVGPGDTVHGVYSVAEVRHSSSDADRLVVTLDIEVLDQHSNQIMTGQDVVLVNKKGLNHG